ncbi:MAG TPA: permease [Desulfatiglandales bacterium]|nr:permease [Desulfatiglandales bacterium]
MDKKGRISKMVVPTIIMGSLAVILLAIGYYKGQGQHIIGLKTGLNMTVEILPLLIFAFIVAGMVQVILPQQLVLKWVGVESGMRGILIGTVAGGLTPGGPYVSLPIIAGLLRSGASVGTMVAFLTGWSLWAVSRLPMEVGILGWKFTLIRLASTFFFPPIAGFIAQSLFAAPK